MEIINRKVLEDLIFIDFRYKDIAYRLKIDFPQRFYNVSSKGLFNHFTILNSFESEYIDELLDGKTVHSFDLATENEILSHISVLLNIMNNGPCAITQLKRAS